MFLVSNIVTHQQNLYIIYVFWEYIFLIYIYLIVILWYLKNNFILKMGKKIFFGKNYTILKMFYFSLNIITHQKISINYFLYLRYKF